ncbi:unnamed protein product, partial [Rotaria sp. Silwood2]
NSDRSPLVENQDNDFEVNFVEIATIHELNLISMYNGTGVVFIRNSIF